MRESGAGEKAKGSQTLHGFMDLLVLGRVER